MPQRDTNCRSVSVYLTMMEERGIDISNICDGLDVTLEEIRKPQTWLAWPVAAELMHRFEDRLGGPYALADMSFDSMMVLATSFYSRMFRLVITPGQLYRLVVKVVAPAICPYHQPTFTQIDDETLHVVLEIPDTGPGCAPFFRSAEGLFRALPAILNMEPR